jgi:polyisoprenoid-binding protein YceI
MSTTTEFMPLRFTARLFVMALLAFALGLAVAATQWATQPAQSKVSFIGTQAGAEFEGVFKKFTADIKFDPKDLATSRFDVKIDVNSVDTKDGERDDTMKTADLFDVKRYPSSTYVADKFTALSDNKGGNKYRATGKLTIRNITRDVPIEFTFEEKAGSAWLKGTTKIKRVDFGVGQGEWKDTSTVANDVKINFALLLKKG